MPERRRPSVPELTTSFSHRVVRYHAGAQTYIFRWAIGAEEDAIDAVTAVAAANEAAYNRREITTANRFDHYDAAVVCKLIADLSPDPEVRLIFGGAQ